MRALPRGIDSTSALLLALRAVFVGLVFNVEELRSRGWTSATFAGSRHSLTFSLDGQDAAARAGQLLAVSSGLTLRGHLVADFQGVLLGADAAGRHRLSIEVLTIETDR
jgi:hypothetical protein